MYQKSGLVFILALMATTADASINHKDYNKCTIIQSNLDRLECFDVLAKNTKGIGDEPLGLTPIKEKGKWQVSIDTNPIDDTKSVTLILDADFGENGWGKAVYLVAKCKNNTTNVYIGWNNYLGNETNVLTRVGENRATTTRWGMSTDKRASISSKPIPFIKKMLQSNKLVTQITPYNESPVTAVFDTSGLETAIKPLRETCNW